MKKVKLMLVSLSVLAVVGGALAFKAKNGPQFCTALYDQVQKCDQACPTPARFKDANPKIFVCSTPTTGDPAHTCDVNGAVLPCGTSILTSIE